MPALPKFSAYAWSPEDELRAQQEAMAQAPQAQPQPSYTNDFLGFLQGLTKQQEAAQSQHAAQMAQEMSGAKEQDAAQRFANMMMAGGATMLGNPNVSSQHMQLAQQNNAQNALQLKDKNFQEWLGKRFDIGKQAGEYNQARYHDLMSQQNQATLAQRLAAQQQEASQFSENRSIKERQLTEEERHNRALEEAAKRRARAGGGAPKLKPLGESHVSQLADFKSAKQAIGQVYDQWKNLFSGESGIERLASRAGKLPGASLFGPSDAKKYAEATSALKTVLGKKTLQDALSESERATFFSNLPMEGDTDEVAKNKVAAMNQLLDNIINNRESGLREQGFDVGGRQAQSPPPQSSGDMVRVVHPDGRTGSIPKGKLEAAIKAGFKVMP